MATIEKTLVLTGLQVKALVANYLAGQGVHERVEALAYAGSPIDDGDLICVGLEDEDLDSPLDGVGIEVEDEVDDEGPTSEDDPDELWIIQDCDGVRVAIDGSMGQYAAQSEREAQEIIAEQTDRWPSLAPFRAVRVK